MFNMPLSEINDAYVQRVVEDGAEEDLYLELKSQLPEVSNNERKEFAEDVSAFANTGGGVILYGIAQSKSGGIHEIAGLQNLQEDSDTLRLIQILNDWLRPRLCPMPEFKQILLGNQKVCLAVKVHRSILAPHMVCKERNNFYTRTAKGKCPMDVDEVRRKFMEQLGAATQIESFLSDRIGKILSGSLRIRCAQGPALILHSVPVGINLESEPFLDHVSICRLTSGLRFFQCYGSSDSRLNCDGEVHYVTSLSLKSSDCDRYVQFFRSGAIEIVDSVIINRNSERCEIPDDVCARIPDGLYPICLDLFRSELKKMSSSILEYYNRITLNRPIIVSLMLTGVAGGFLAPRRMTIVHTLDLEKYCFDRDVIKVPEVYIENPMEVGNSLGNQLWHSVCQACGYAEPPNAM